GAFRVPPGGGSAARRSRLPRGKRAGPVATQARTESSIVGGPEREPLPPEDLTTMPHRPLAAAPAAPLAETRPRVLVVGAGVIGLPTASCLHENGYDVTVVADRFAPDLTSVVAGALWEWPPAVCGRHGDPRSLERSKSWCRTSYHRLKQLAAEFGAEET